MATINVDIAQKIDIIVRENNSATINLVIKSTDGTPFYLLGYNVTHTVEKDGEILITKTNGSGVTDTTTGSGTLDSQGASGMITIKFTPTDLSILPGTYKHKLVFTKSDEKTTWMYGKFKINND